MGKIYGTLIHSFEATDVERVKLKFLKTLLIDTVIIDHVESMNIVAGYF